MSDSKVRSLQYVKEFKEITDSLIILDKHGQGTFASVFTVKDKRKPESNQVYALKMIIPTVDVRRIENEIRILRRLGFYLVDFGLAHSEEFGDIDSRWERLFEGPCENLAQNKENSQHTLDESDSKNTPSKSISDTNSSTHSKSLARLGLESQRSIHKSSSTSRLSPNSKNQSVTSQNIIPGTCVCGLRVAVCRGCKHLPRAPAGRRGGTLGFRPPEVMMRHVEQTTAVDIWAVGVIFLSFLSGRYPFIRAEDDLDVLHAFTHLVGYERMQMAARRLGRRLLLDPKPPFMEAADSPASWLEARCAAIRRHEKKFAGLPPLLSGSSKSQSTESAEPVKATSIALGANHSFPSAAYDLLARLLEPNPYKRISAYNALRHPFFCLSSQKNSGSSLKRPLGETDQHPRNRPRLSFAENSPTFIQRPQFC